MDQDVIVVAWDGRLLEKPFLSSNLIDQTPLAHSCNNVFHGNNDLFSLTDHLVYINCPEKYHRKLEAISF
ncbi:hypothetical protein YC2023_021249 [Brassica napus]